MWVEARRWETTARFFAFWARVDVHRLVHTMGMLIADLAVMPVAVPRNALSVPPLIYY